MAIKLVASQSKPVLPYLKARAIALDEFLVEYVGDVMERAGGNKAEAARLAGMDKTNFRRNLYYPYCAILAERKRVARANVRKAAGRAK